ncbi:MULTISPECIES: hypothetical protein [unclassified Nocardiopsis]|uniref:hypothetical protein n=1 Tax=unclassified Nocardiopsis TaxID=2649073 RepID=UPI000939D8F0|nr:hypothetical protein [Nocardiopsis sp. TSRI0078]
MPFEERRLWVYLAVAVVVPAAYLVFILGEAQGTAVAEIAYQPPLLTAAVASVVTTIVLNAVVAALGHKDAHLRDQRDREIDQRGDRVGFVVMSALTAVPLSLTLLEHPHFWIANTIYLAYVLSAVVSSIVKLVAYRKGF